MKNFYKFNSGVIVLLQFPFTDLSTKKVRPALIICDDDNEDALVAPISTTVNARKEDIVLTNADYKDVGLPAVSCVRYKKLFTLSKSLIIRKVAELKQKPVRQIKQNIVDYILRS